MRLAPLFHDHAVLQRDLPLPVWGTTGPGQEVVVTIAGTTARTRAGPDGAWLLRLPPLAAGGPHELVARSTSGEARAADVLIGDVWICSGQSNMAWKLSQTTQGTAISPSPRIRLLSVDTPACLGRQSAIDGRWQAADARSLAAFSAVGGWFGQAIHAALDVPIGLICNAWSGTRIQAWISREALVRDPLGVGEVQHYENYVYATGPTGSEAYASMADWEARGPHQDAGNLGLGQGWAAAECADDGWSSMPLPAPWQERGHPGSGVFWFRRSVQVPAAWAGRTLELHLGAIDKHDDTYVNGERVGGLSWEDGRNTWCTLRSYTVPAHLVRPGRLTIAIRVRSHVNDGGLTGPEAAMRLQPVGCAEEAIPLHGAWSYRIEQDWGRQTPPTPRWEPGNANTPYTLFDSRLAPLIPYGIRGALWYQGEGNAHEPDSYRRLLPLMIDDWRRNWGQGDFPFLLVQLANHKPPAEQPGPSSWAELREAQAAALAVPQTGMAVIIDAGDAANIHPDDKRTVGDRLARWALAVSYGRGGTPCGPIFTGFRHESQGRIRCSFDHAHGLRTRDGRPPSHIDIAGVDRIFRRAEARIDGESLVVWHPEVPRPMAVRYAWADNPAGCNLVNAQDLPAAPFRTDAWAH